MQAELSDGGAPQQHVAGNEGAEGGVAPAAAPSSELALVEDSVGSDAARMPEGTKKDKGAAKKPPPELTGPSYYFSFGAYEVVNNQIGKAEEGTRADLAGAVRMPSAGPGWWPAATGQGGDSGATGSVPPQQAEGKPAAVAKQVLEAQQVISVLQDSEDRALHLFTWRSPLRRFAAMCISHPRFEWLIMILIITSTFALFVDMPHLNRQNTMKKTIHALNIFFSIIFLLEACLKILCSGFVFSSVERKAAIAKAHADAAAGRRTPGAKGGKLTAAEQFPEAWESLTKPYLHDPWNCLDFFIVVVSLISLINPNMKALRALRALRPLRLVSRHGDLKITVDTLLLSLPAMTSLITVSTLFFLIFAILGMELFGGRFGTCMDPLFSELPYGSRVVPGMAGNQTDYEECMGLSRYNLTRRTTDGILLSDMADIEPGTRWLEYVEFPQWMYPQVRTHATRATCRAHASCRHRMHTTHTHHTTPPPTHRRWAASTIWACR